MFNKLEIVDINIENPLSDNHIFYVGQYGTSGYAQAAKGYICDFIIKRIPVSWFPLKYDDSELEDSNYYNILAKSVINKPVKRIDTIILHCLANLFPQYKLDILKQCDNPNIIGYSVWETSTLPNLWVECINESLNEVWCPSKYNHDVFKDSGVKIPIKIVPHVFLKNELPKKEHVIIRSIDGRVIKNDPNILTFYNISEINERKNIEGLLKAYCKAFTSKDPVRLILKVHYRDYTKQNIEFCLSYIDNIIKDYFHHPELLIITKNLSELEILGLHSIGDYHISLTRSEAFGLTLYDAFNYGKKIIVTGYGGHLDYLGENYSGLINYNLEDINKNSPIITKYYLHENQKWATPNMDHAIYMMRQALRN